jgi:subtilisin family serine protease
MAVACSHEPIEPTVGAPSLAEFGIDESSADVSDQHVVLFAGGVTADFAEQVTALGGTVEFTHEIGFAVVKGLDDAAAEQIGALSGVQQIERDQAFQLDPITNDELASIEDGPNSLSDPTTALFFPRQWNMRAIEADAAWAAGRTGSADVTVAILDTGIDYTYPDLAGRVDLSRSVSFEAFDDFLVSIFFPGRHPISDLYFHGTHVASTAVSNSNIIAGVTSQTTLIGVKVCNVFGSCPFSSVISGVLHATDVGADVMNMSLGEAFSKAGLGVLVGFINRVYNYAHQNGVTVVVAAGNENWDLDHNGNAFKTYCDAANVICVAATGPTSSAGDNGPWTDVDARAPYSNFGRSSINVAAPGGTGPGGGWVWAACSQTSLVVPICQTGVFILGVNGTSMSSPHVAGLASLMVEDVGRNPGQVRARIQQSADDIGEPGVDPYYGKGRINVANATGN